MLRLLKSVVAGGGPGDCLGDGHFYGGPVSLMSYCYFHNRHGRSDHRYFITGLEQDLRLSLVLL